MLYNIFLAAALVLSILAIIFQGSQKRGKRGFRGFTGSTGSNGNGSTGSGLTPITFSEAATFTDSSLAPIGFSADLRLSYVKLGSQVSFQLDTNDAVFATSGTFALCDQVVPVAFRPTQNLQFLLPTRPGQQRLAGSLTISIAGVIQIWVSFTRTVSWDFVDSNSFSSSAFSWIV